MCIIKNQKQIRCEARVSEMNYYFIFLGTTKILNNYYYYYLYKYIIHS